MIDQLIPLLRNKTELINQGISEHTLSLKKQEAIIN
jgi:hypothetical protein